MGDNAAVAVLGAATPRRVAKRRSGPRSKTSPYVGVTQYKRTGHWEAHIWIQNPRGKGHQRHLGSYETAEDAARCYDRAALKMRGDAAELNFPRHEYDQDEFLLEHARTDRFRFLDLLRARFSMQPAARPGGAQPRPRRQRSVGSDGGQDERGESPRTRTVVRVPRGVQRVTVHQRPLSVEPLPAAWRPAAGAQQLQQWQQRQQHEASQSPSPAAPAAAQHQSAAGRGKGLLLPAQPSLSAAASEEGLLISTAPMGSAQMQHLQEALLWPTPGGATLGSLAPPRHSQSPPSHSAATTPCSSPAPARLLPIPSDLPPPPKLRRTSSSSEGVAAAAGPAGPHVSGGAALAGGVPAFMGLPPSLTGLGLGSIGASGVGGLASPALLQAAMMPPSLAPGAFLLQAGSLGGYNPLLMGGLALPAGLALHPVTPAAAAAAAATGLGSPGSGAPATAPSGAAASPPAGLPLPLFAAAPSNGVAGAGGAEADGGAGQPASSSPRDYLRLVPSCQQSPARLDAAQDWLGPILPLSEPASGSQLWAAGPAGLQAQQQ